MLIRYRMLLESVPVPAREELTAGDNPAWESAIAAHNMDSRIVLSSIALCLDFESAALSNIDTILVPRALRHSGSGGYLMPVTVARVF